MIRSGIVQLGDPFPPREAIPRSSSESAGGGWPRINLLTGRDLIWDSGPSPVTAAQHSNRTIRVGCCSLLGGRGCMQPMRTYRGYQLIDLSSLVRNGAYRARVALVRDSAGDSKNQRFLDFETFTDMGSARLRAIEGAVAWIDEELGRAKPSMPGPPIRSA
jgi:hypothetical protein